MPIVTMPIGAGGAILQAFVGCSVHRIAALQKQNQPLPDLVPVTALIDTGASCTAIDEQVMASLGIPPSGETTIQTPSTGPQPHKTLQYDVAIYIPGAAKDNTLLTFSPALPVVGSQLKHQGFDMLMGCDILSRGVFLYNGHNQTFTIAF